MVRKAAVIATSAVLGLFLLGRLGLAQTQPIMIDHFLGLHDDESSAAIQDQESQDCLNVEINDSATAVIKRPGYSRIASLSVATSPVNGSFSFTDPNGNRQDIVCHDRLCSKSTNGGAFAVFIDSAGRNSSGLMPTRWSFVQVNGTLYGANDARDAPITYDGTTLAWPATMPRGSLMELTKDRLVVADPSSNPNRIYYSQQGTYTNFTTGINSVDPYNDDIGSPGDKVTGLKYARGKLYIFKTTSVTACILGDQYNSRCYPVTSVVGTNDPASIVESPDGIYFRGNDRHYWKIDDTGLTLISKNIKNLVISQTAGSTQNNTQTTQADWAVGTQSPSGSWDTATISGSVFPSSYTFSDDNQNALSSGTFTDAMYQSGVIGGEVFENISFSSAYYDAGQGAMVCKNWTTADTIACGVGLTDYNCSVFSSSYVISGSSIQAAADLAGFDTRILLASDDSLLYVIKTSGTSSSCAYFNINVSTQTSDIKIQVKSNYTGKSRTSTAFSPSRLPNGFVHYGYTSKTVTGFGVPNYVPIWVIPHFWYAASSTFTSRCVDTGYNSPTWGPFTTSFSSTTASGLYFSTLVSSACTGAFDTALNVSPNNKPTSAQRRAIKYQAIFQTRVATQTATMKTASLLYSTTGQFMTQCIQPGSAITAWGIVSCAEAKVGGGNLAYYMSSGTACGSMNATWTAQSNNAAVSIATAPAVKIRFDSLLTSSTDQAQVDACTLYWTNGTAAQPVWGVYESNKNALYWATAINNSSSNNRLLKYDLNWNEWFPMDISASAPRIINSAFYYGSSSGGYWNQYGPDGSIYSDNGSAINAYWKSKDYGGGADTFSEKNLNRISLVTKNQVSGNMTATYQTSNNASGSYTVSLATTSGITYVRANYALPLLSPYQFFNVKFGNNSAVPFEVNAFRLDYSVQPWKPMNP